MAIITGHRKWDNNEYNWTESNEDNLSISGAFAHYTPIIHNPDEGINYIICTYGNRVEDNTKNPTTLSDSKMNLNKFMDYFKTKEENYKLITYFMDKDAPIVEDSKRVASYIDLLNASSNTKSVTLFSLSKGSCLATYVPKFIKKEESLKKLNVINVAAPYEGTILASPRIFYPMIKELFFGSEVLYKVFKNVYESISSNSHMDYDIAVKDGICLQSYNAFSNDFIDALSMDKILNNKELLKLVKDITENPYKYYDPSFISDIFSEENIEALKKIKSFTNLTTGIDENTLIDSIKRLNVVGIAMCFINKHFLDSEGDGLVKTSSEKLIENYMDIKSTHLDSAQHNIVRDKQFTKVLEITHNVITKK